MGLLDSLSKLYSQACLQIHNGRPDTTPLKDWLHNLLYEKLNNEFEKLEWFTIEFITPLESFFDNVHHRSMDVKDMGMDLANKIIFVNHVGLIHLNGYERLRNARVIVGM